MDFWERGGRAVGGAGGSSGSERGGCRRTGDTDDVLQTGEANGVHDLSVKKVEQHGFELRVLWVGVKEF